MERVHDVMRLLRHFRSRLALERGAVLVEYVLLVSIVAAGSIGGLTFVSTRIDGWVNSSGKKISTVSSTSADTVAPIPGTASVSCANSGCTALVVTLSGWSGAASYTYTWEHSAGGCGDPTGWSAAGSSSTVPVTSPGGYRVTVQASNSSGKSPPVTTCVEI
jgi:Flp pilus assembly pilin Flp